MEFSVVAIWVGCSQETILKKVTFVQKPEGSESRKRKRFFSSDGRVGRSVKLGQSKQGDGVGPCELCKDLALLE